MSDACARECGVSPSSDEPHEALYEYAVLCVKLHVLLARGNDNITGVEVGERRAERHCAALVVDRVHDDAA